MTVKIVTDSASDLPQAVLEQYDISVVPLYINVAGHSYLDGLEMTHRDFYQRLPGWTEPPTTSAPAPGRLVETYQSLAEQGASGIVSIHISANLSNTVNVARLAAQGVESVPVSVIDGGQVTLTTGLAVIEAARAAAAGASVEQITDLVADLGSRSYTFAALDTLEFVRRSGRMSRFAYGLGTWLKIKPILKMHLGRPAMDRVRTRERAIQRLEQLVTELGPLEQLYVVHTDALDRAEDLQRRLQHLFPAGQPSYTIEVTPVIGAHIGPGILGFACVTAKEVSS